MSKRPTVLMILDGYGLNDELIEKLTGIEAVYFAQVIRHIQMGA